MREYAVEGTSDFEIASLQYRAREVVEVITTIRGEEVPVCGLKPSWMDDVLSDEITHGTVYLQGSVPPQNVDKLIGAAQVYARDAVVEQQTAAE